MAQAHESVNKDMKSINTPGPIEAKGSAELIYFGDWAAACPSDGRDCERYLLYCWPTGQYLSEWRTNWPRSESLSRTRTICRPALVTAAELGEHEWILQGRPTPAEYICVRVLATSLPLDALHRSNKPFDNRNISRAKDLVDRIRHNNVDRFRSNPDVVWWWSRLMTRSRWYPSRNTRPVNEEEAITYIDTHKHTHAQAEKKKTNDDELFADYCFLAAVSFVSPLLGTFSSWWINTMSLYICTYFVLSLVSLAIDKNTPTFFWTVTHTYAQA